MSVVCLNIAVQMGLFSPFCLLEELLDCKLKIL